MRTDNSSSCYLFRPLLRPPPAIHLPIQFLLPFKDPSNPSTDLPLHYHHLQLRLHQELTKWSLYLVSTPAPLQAIFYFAIGNLLISLIYKSELYLPTLLPKTLRIKSTMLTWPYKALLIWAPLVLPVSSEPSFPVISMLWPHNLSVMFPSTMCILHVLPPHWGCSSRLFPSPSSQLSLFLLNSAELSVP